MCGINGIFSIGKLDPGLIGRMNDRIVHRGPDGEGVYVADNVQLGMRRLSIIDLSTGDQPIYSEDRRFVIVFNGEIYNYRELRRRLEKNGHRFYTASDTEVIVHLYEECRERCVEELNGMFAFAVYDSVGNTLFLARDRLGKKPLHYVFQDDRLYFASELKSILAVTERKYRISMKALESFFALTFIPAPHTMYDGIYKLEAGCCMEVRRDLSYTIRRYWHLANRRSAATPLTDARSAGAHVRELLTDAVERRMIADVPLGAFLSGGVDSSIVVSIMCRLSQLPVNTFSIGNTLSCYDESAKARHVAKQFKTNHTEWIVDNEYVCSIVDTVLKHFDEPFADSSALPSYVVAQLARKQVKVVLTGDGGDELFAGYERYRIYRYLRWYRLLPAALRNFCIRPAINSMPYPASLSLLVNKVKKVVNNSGDDTFEQYHAMQRLGYSEPDIARLLASQGNFGNLVAAVRSRYEELADASVLARAQYTDIMVGLEGDMLVKVDRVTMQNSVEARSPFLDYRLVEASFGISDTLKMRGGRLKSILKDEFASDFPRGFLEKPKMGFGIPVGEFLANELKPAMERLLASEALATSNIVDVAYVKELFVRHCAGARQTFLLWPVYVFALWLEQHREHLMFE